MPEYGPRKTGIEANGAGAKLRRTVRCLIAVTVVFGFLESIGGCVADTDEMKLNWEWPAGRTAEIRVLVRVTKVEKEGKGPLGIGQSPSMGSHLPDATVLRGEIVGRPKSSVAEQSSQVSISAYCALGLVSAVLLRQNSAVTHCL